MCVPPQLSEEDMYESVSKFHGYTLQIRSYHAQAQITNSLGGTWIFLYYLQEARAHHNLMPIKSTKEGFLYDKPIDNHYAR